MSRDSSRTGERFEDLVAALEAGLREHVPGFEALDRDLELDPAPGLGLPPHEEGGEERPARRADVAGVDGHGRLVLVLLVDGKSDETALAAFDALAFARGSLAVLGQHFGPRRISAARDPLVVLVAESFAPRVLQALGLVAGASLALFEMRAVRSAGAGAAYLVARAIGPGEVRRSPQDFAAALPPPLRALAEALMRRAACIDDDVETDFAGERLVWRVRGAEIGGLETHDRALRCESAAGAESVRIESAPDIEAALDLLVREHLRCLGDQGQKDGPRIELAKLARPTEPLLSAEEIAAFREA